MYSLKNDPSKKCTIDNLHPNWREQELAEEMIVEEKDSTLLSYSEQCRIIEEDDM